jgi:hypothetical protein
MLFPHFVGDAGAGEAHKFSEGRVRSARAAGQHRKAGHGRIGMPVKRAPNFPPAQQGTLIPR